MLVHVSACGCIWRAVTKKQSVRHERCWESRCAFVVAYLASLSNLVLALVRHQKQQAAICIVVG